MSETTVGSIVGFLRLNISDFEAGIAKAQAMAEKLDHKDVDIRVKVDTAGAETKLAAVDAATKKVDRSTASMGHSQEGASRHARFLVGVLLTVGPALIPLAAATAGLAAGFGTMGAAGVLAIVGIRQEMKAGTMLGASYTGMLQTLKGNLTTLGHTAAAGVLQPFQQSVADLQKRMPVLNSIIGDFSAMTGRTAGVLTTGLVSAFIALEPLSRDAGMYIYTLAQRFAELMSGPGVVLFGDYVRSVFPHVMQQVEAIVGAVIRLVAAFSPFGTGILTLIGAFADAINAVPVDVLSKIATGGLAIFLGFKVFGLLSMPIHEVGVALRFMGVSAETAAVGMRTLTIAAAGIGVLIAVATIAYTAHSESVRKDQEAVNSLTDALIRGHGVIEADTVAERANALAKDGTLAAAKLLGYGLDDVTLASMGNAKATANVTAHTNDLIKAYGGMAGAAEASGKSVSDGLDAAIKVDAATKNGVKTLDLAKQAYNAYTDATATGAMVTDTHTSATQRSVDAQAKVSMALALATQKMHDENDAAGVLRGSLDLLNGKALSAANAQNAFDSSLANMGDHVTTTGKKIVFTTTSIKDMSTASVALRGQLNGQVENLQRVVEANGGLANSTGKARDQMIDMRKKIIDNAVAHGVNRAAVTAYIDKLLKIPKSVGTTAKMDADAAIKKANALKAAADAAARSRQVYIGAGVTQALSAVASVQRAIDNLKGRQVYVGAGQTKAASANGNIFNAYASGGIAPITAFANGGENHVAMIGNGITRQWNEPETGGEAYIPLARSKRARSTAIWEETGKRLGVGSSGGSGGGSATEARTCTHIWQIDGREIGRAAVNHMDNVLTGGLTMARVS